VPPDDTGKAVPDNVSAKVPADVIGEFATDRKAGAEIATEVTVPVPGAAGVVHVGVAPAPADVSTWPAAPTEPDKDKADAAAIARPPVTVAEVRVRPETFVTDAPSATVLVPIVTKLFVSPEFGIDVTAVNPAVPLPTR